AVRDADPDEPGDQQLGVVFSIMNGRGGESTQGAPDEAKNIIAVGGTGSGRPGSPSGDDLCTCTAHGPNLDGRRLVDLVAPGQIVASVRATQGTLCGIPPREFPSPLHATCTGTSFASPHVSGAYAVFTQAFRDANGADPSPALVKAALVNTATDLSAFGGLDADGEPLGPVPNDQQGWGRLDLGQTMAQWNGGTVVFRDQDRLFDASGDREVFEVEVADAGAPLRATLTWTDAPGHGQGGGLAAWVNDLDLELVSPSGAVYRGNVFADGWSTTGGGADWRNNLENVWVERPEAGTWTVRVLGTNIIGDGVPSDGDLTDQDFAVVVSNANESTSRRRPLPDRARRPGPDRRP
ncbi:MAG: S8 family serine peptidase, partial [Actinobacteria bacterium]|nr:S8 family serine peptidase [Actinomycetota bacterium]